MFVAQLFAFSHRINLVDGLGGLEVVLFEDEKDGQSEGEREYQYKCDSKIPDHFNSGDVIEIVVEDADYGQ